MNEEPAIIREQHLQRLAPFCRGLGEAMSRAGLTPDQAREIWRAAVSGECSRCGILVSGEELFALSQAPSAPPPSPAIQRLSLGYCARPGCECYFCRMTFRKHDQVDWPALLARADAIAAEQATPAGKLGTADYIRGFLRIGLTRRVGIALAILLVLVLIRQWYCGGRIPLVREPEHFRVDPAPETEQPAEHRAP